MDMTEDRRVITIVTDSDEEQYRIGNRIHEQLVGNQDYIDSNIILNIDDTPRTIKLWISKGCKFIPTIAIY